MTHPLGRRAGILVPLFSIPSSKSWGIGEIPDLMPLARWLTSAGQRLVQLLPIHEMPAGETSPYSALSAMAIDPQFIALTDVDEFNAMGGEASLSPAERAELDRARRSPTIAYHIIRPLKDVVLRRAFRYFRRSVQRETTRATRFDAFARDESWWLDDYALYRALRTALGDRPWTDWPSPLRTRDDAALGRARRDLAEEIDLCRYTQWLAHEQWALVRAQLRDVALLGDLPFTVAVDSADVWTRQGDFRMDVSVGVPPDAFSATGQDWGLPGYQWDVIAANGFVWLHARGRRYAALYDGFRVDHLVGFYRTFTRPVGVSTGPGHFTPSTEHEQTRLGEQVLRVLQDSGAAITAEDLGTVPDFVRASLRHLGLAGYKVFRWEREWDAPGQPFIDPVSYPRASVATSGTHDTETTSAWWRQASRDERRAVLEVSSIRHHLTPKICDAAEATSDMLPEVARAIFDSLNASGSDVLILPIQDPFGWTDRINQPATINDRNWTWRLPWPVDEMANEPEAEATAHRLRAWAARHGRCPGA